MPFKTVRIIIAVTQKNAFATEAVLTECLDVLSGKNVCMEVREALF